MKYAHFLLALIFGFFLQACDTNKIDKEATIKKFQKHIEILASDEFEGRETGQEGEQKAAEYIENEFSNIGLTPRGDEGDYFQYFDFLAGKKFEGKNELEIEGKAYARDESYFPMNFSGNDELEGILIHVGFGIQAPELGT